MLICPLSFRVLVKGDFVRDGRLGAGGGRRERDGCVTSTSVLLLIASGRESGPLQICRHVWIRRYSV